MTASFRTYSENITNFNRDADSSAIIGNPYNAELNATFKNITIVETAFMNDMSISGTVEFLGPVSFDDPIYIDSNVNQTGNYNIRGSINQTGGNHNLFGNIVMTGTINQTGGNHNLAGNFNQTGTYTIIGSLNQTGGNHNLVGNINMTGSINQTGGNHNLVGSINQTGNHNLVGNINMTGNINQTAGNYNLVGNINEIGYTTMNYSLTDNSIVFTDSSRPLAPGSSNNVIVGNQAYFVNTHSLTNVVSIGNFNRQDSTSDIDSIFIGTRVAPVHQVTITDGIMIGTKILENANSLVADYDKSIFIGNRILQNYDGSNPVNNMFIGTDILPDTSTSNITNNIIMGSNTLENFNSSLAAVQTNVIIGMNVFNTATTLSDLSFFSENTMVGTNIFNRMTFVGSSTNPLQANTLFGQKVGAENALAGYSDFQLNTILGDRAGYLNSSLTGLNRNTAIGQAALYNNLLLGTSSSVVAVGSLAASTMIGVTSATNCTFIGTAATTFNFSSGPATNRMALGANSVVAVDNACVIGVVGTASVRQTKVGIGMTVPSACLHVQESINGSDPTDIVRVDNDSGNKIFTVVASGANVYNNAGNTMFSVDANGINLYGSSVPSAKLNIQTSVTTATTYNFPQITNFSTPNVFVSAPLVYTGSFTIILSSVTPVSISSASPISCTVGIIPFTFDENDSQPGRSGLVTVSNNNYITTSKAVFLQLLAVSVPPGSIPVFPMLASVNNGGFSFYIIRTTSQSLNGFNMKLQYMIV